MLCLPVKTSSPPAENVSAPLELFIDQLLLLHWNICLYHYNAVTMATTLQGTVYFSPWLLLRGWKLHLLWIIMQSWLTWCNNVKNAEIFYTTSKHESLPKRNKINTIWRSEVLLSDSCICISLPCIKHHIESIVSGVSSCFLAYWHMNVGTD